ncbi:homeodomain-interacting protein kinase 4-like [Spea bombifrons]|uniref:homeodomain-interacting protein kinase 4-like n=1 Tax=Spea bombifrons TaxID=233779 RepID=UPI002348F3EC|nr:homeodomain-interacting protein kinase 4-like [Spea bombifrons]
MKNPKSMSDLYNVIDVLGKGSFGEVVKCQKRDSGKQVAIKILKYDCSSNYAIEHEIEMLNALRKVDVEKFNILQFYEHFHDDSKHYMVFELLQKNLFQYQEEIGFAPLPVRHIRTISSQVLIALSKLSELSIIHADLKPENIVLVDQDRYPFRVKVIDFGCSYNSNEVRGMKEPCIQTLFYRAPEILLGLPFSEKVDMWSLGCIMAELHLGAPLYPGRTEYDQVRYICETQGLPKSHLLDTASKAPRFFNRKAGFQWALKTVDEYQMETRVKPAEWRKYIFKSLDHLQFIKYASFVNGNTEMLAKYSEQKDMVEIIKCMLTWDSHERINPEAAMNHQFISRQHLRTNYTFTKHYQFVPESLSDSMKKETGQHFDAPPDICDGTKDLAYYDREMELDRKPPFNSQNENTTSYGHHKASLLQNISRYIGQFVNCIKCIFNWRKALPERQRDDEWSLIDEVDNV